MTAPEMEVGDIVFIPGKRAHYRINTISDGGAKGRVLALVRLGERVREKGTVPSSDQEHSPRRIDEIPYWKCRKVPRPAK